MTLAWNARVSHHSLLCVVRWVKAGMWRHVEKLEKCNIIQAGPRPWRTGLKSKQGELKC